MTAFNCKWKYDKLAVRRVVRVLRPTQNAVILHCCLAEEGYEISKDLLNTLVQPFLCSLKLNLFGGAPCRRGLFQAPSTPVT